MTDPGFCAPDFAVADDFYPDGLTHQAMTALQREVDAELRREGYPVGYGERPLVRSGRRRDRSLSTTAGQPTVRVPETSGPSRQGSRGRADDRGAGDGVELPTGQDTGDGSSLLLTPAQAAALLQVGESWLRRRAGQRRIPCTMLGRHLRFSRADLDVIVAAGARSSGTSRRRSRGARRP